MAKIDIDHQEESEQEAEAHVKKIMGPSQFDKPGEEPETDVPAADEAAPGEPEASVDAAMERPKWLTSPEVDEKAADVQVIKSADAPASDEGVDELLAKPVGELADDQAVSEIAEDAETEKAVEEITKHEGDEVLAGLDAAAEKAVVMKPKFFERIKDSFQSWWDNPIKRYVTIGVLLALLLVVALVPVVRAYTLNTVGVRSSVSVSVLDSTTTLPLKNVTVDVAGETAKTDSRGKAIVQDVKLGKQKVVIRKQGFAPNTRTISIGLGTTSIPTTSLKAIGTQFTFNATDYLSGKVVAGAEVASGQASALTDKKGKAVLTVPPSDDAKLTVFVSAKGYRTEKVTLDTSATKPTDVQLVSAKKEVFVSKQSGKYDVYSIDVDGKNKKVLLPASGNETENIALSVNPEGTKAAVVSTRDNQRDNDGYLLSTLTIVDIETGSNATIDHAQRISLIGWSNDRLAYSAVIASASAANPNRQKIYAYNYAAAKRVQLANANYFNAALSVGDAIYYAVSFADANANASFNKINIDGTGKQTLVNKEVWTVFRSGYNTLSLQTSAGWLSYTTGATTTKPGTAPATYAPHQYTDNAGMTQALWIDTRDGKGALMNHTVSTGKDVVLTTQAGLNGGLRWLDDNTVIYRLTTERETADYVLSLQGGEPKKITDVTATASIVQAN